MKKPLSMFALLAALFVFSGVIYAEPLTVGNDDSIQTILAANQGNRVTIKLKSGDELSGKVGNVTQKLLVLQELTGKEFYDAAIDIEKVAAVIVRARNN